MPKEKKRGPTTGNTQRHAPLGQVIADDENRSKYATVRSRQRNESDRKNKKYQQEEDLLDEKTTQKIFELSKEQMLEIEMEEQREMELMRKKTSARTRGQDSHSDDDDGDDDDDGNLSAMGEILDDDEDE
jgi:essential nuclear protein 1